MSSNSEGGEKGRETHISNEISARIVIFIENDTVPIVARKTWASYH